MHKMLKTKKFVNSNIRLQKEKYYSQSQKMASAGDPFVRWFHEKNDFNMQTKWVIKAEAKLISCFL